MSRRSQPPIFCDDCASLALAMLDDAPLCAKCLRESLGKAVNPCDTRIEPLELDTTMQIVGISAVDSTLPDS